MVQMRTPIRKGRRFLLIHPALSSLEGFAKISFINRKNTKERKGNTNGYF